MFRYVLDTGGSWQGDSKTKDTKKVNKSDTVNLRGER